MQIWADATREIVNVSVEEEPDPAMMDFLLSIIEENRNIPVLLTDSDGNILMHRNFALPQEADSLSPFTLSQRNMEFLKSKYEKLRGGTNMIEIDMGEAGKQYLYYEDSRILRALNYYPYIQVLVLMAFILIVYYAVSSTKRAEQNKVWVGLSKETAHQLGTPISSLMAWMELLKDLGVDAETVSEMNKDVTRLSTIASRFSKIGSKPAMQREDLNDLARKCTDYMKTRISKRISLTFISGEEPVYVMASSPLAEWVMENLIKNAVDAMDGDGSITVTVSSDKDNGVIDVTDTGKGISKKNQKNIFSPSHDFWS